MRSALSIPYFVSTSFLIMVLTAQNPQGSHPIGLVFPISGHPLLVDQIEERVHRSPDGSIVTQTTSGRIYRDQAGRMRSEWIAQKGPDEATARTIAIADPLGGVIIALEPLSRTAVRVTIPNSRPDAFGLSLPTIVDPLPNGRWKTETTSVAKRVIEGIEFEGTRITNISEDEPGLRIIYEWWSSKALGLVGLATASGPNGEHTAKIQHIDWRIPDAELFAVPSEYTVRSLNLPSPDRE